MLTIIAIGFVAFGFFEIYKVYAGAVNAGFVEPQKQRLQGVKH